MIDARFEFAEQVLRLDPDRLVFVDEFGINLAMTRRYARAPVGQRAYGTAPVCYGDNITLVCGVRLRGALAPLMFPGPMTGLAFETYVHRVLAPQIGPGDVVIWDGLGAHRSADARAAIAARGARVLPLPPYSPEFSPVEHCGSKLKTHLRSAAARTFETLVDAVCEAFEDISRNDILGWFTHDGYCWPPKRKPL